jgi:hypothetical protein
MITIPAPVFARSHEADALIDAADAEDWTPMPTKRISDEEVEQWIARFAETGDVSDELGYYKSHYGTLMHALAKQWVLDKEAVGDLVGPHFWKWAYANARTERFGSAE